MKTEDIAPGEATVLRAMSDASHRRAALLLALAGFSIFSIGDSITKSTAGMWPGPAVAALRFSLSAVGLVIVVALVKGRSAFVIPKPWIQVGRGASVAFASGCFFTALQLMPLATATAIGFTAPMMTALISAIFLREPASPKVWIVALLAFTGVALVLKPNLSDLGWTAFFPLASAFGMSMLMIFNRLGADSGGSPLAMQMVIAAIASPFLAFMAFGMHLTGIPAFHIGPISWGVIIRCGIVAFTGTIGHWLLYLATTQASAALIAPMSYVGILFAVGLGWMIYGDFPDVASFAGSALIIISGLWLFRTPKRRG